MSIVALTVVALLCSLAGPLLGLGTSRGSDRLPRWLLAQVLCTSGDGAVQAASVAPAGADPASPGPAPGEPHRSHCIACLGQGAPVAPPPFAWTPVPTVASSAVATSRKRGEPLDARIRLAASPRAPPSHT